MSCIQKKTIQGLSSNHASVVLEMPTLKEIEDDEKVLQENSKMVATMNEENIKGKDYE